MASRGLVAFEDRDSDGRPCLDSASGESICAVQSSVSIALGDAPLQQPGTLHVTTKRLIWISDADQHGYAVDFLSLSMHAISRDLDAYPMPCIYTQIEMEEDDDYDYGDDEDGDEMQDGGRDAGDLSRVQEMRFVPSDSSVLENLFKTLCDCALLNPDPEEEREGEADWFFNEEEVLTGAIGHANGEVRDHDVTGLSELHLDDEQFDDADESEA